MVEPHNKKEQISQQNNGLSEVWVFIIIIITEAITL